MWERREKFDRPSWYVWKYCRFIDRLESFIIFFLVYIHQCVAINITDRWTIPPLLISKCFWARSNSHKYFKYIHLHKHTHTQITFIDSIECRLLSASPIHFSFNNIRNICHSLRWTKSFHFDVYVMRILTINNMIERWERNVRMRREMRSEKNCGEKNEKRCDNATSI